MAIHPLAGKPAPADILIDLDRLEKPTTSASPTLKTRSNWSASAPAATAVVPSITRSMKRIFSPSRRRSASTARAKISRGRSSWVKTRMRYRARRKRVRSKCSAANGVETVIQRGDGFTPTPSISRAILVHNRGKNAGLADGIVITPSHNPAGGWWL